MNKDKIQFTVFTKPWKIPAKELARYVKHLGFNGVELPVRDGYEVTPENVEKKLPEVVKIFADNGLTVPSIAPFPPVQEKVIASCGNANVKIIRMCVEISPEIGYMKTMKQLWKEFDELVPVLERYNVSIGIQNHCDLFIPHALGIRYLIERYSPKHFCAVWDPMHCALNGEDPRLAVDILWDYLGMVNLKNAYWRRTTGTEAEYVQWKYYLTSGRQGLASWPLVAQVLKERNYKGIICLTAEYTDERSVDRLIKEDIEFAKSLF
ncbi:MAG: sugar phosphate isomerase/epimerase [Candidatus Omnitrophica bacterium]|nr:sugar phosphate isomerase/epimerase [Candidatus Omnitrophota bacterium]